MQTIFVTGSDTGIGKTRVAATIGRLLWRPNLRIQFVKPVETGRQPNEPGDADEASKTSGITAADAFTLLRFPDPLAPLAAAGEGEGCSMRLLLARWQTLPPTDLRIVEGAGGIAVPIDPDGSDWCAFSRAIQTDRIVLVTPDRLGGINQARLIAAYAKNQNLPAGVWLNETAPQPENIRQSNREGIASLPVWATQRFNAPLPEDPNATLRHLTA